jgi:muramoyltetrapeptide carboxypeptidase
MKKSQVLKPGDKIGVVAPGAAFDREKFDKGMSVIKELGFIPILGENLFKRDFIFAGTPKERIQDFFKMARDPKIKAIWCVRGGSGSYSVAEAISKSLPPKSSKLVIGLSDITAIHLAVNQKWKWAGLHAPLVDRLGHELHTGLEKDFLKQTLFNSDFALKVNDGLLSIGKKGRAKGVVTGGNLMVLASSLGTSWEVDTKDKILFIEETGEVSYRLDRLLAQLQQAGKFKNIRGLLIGDFTDCIDKDGIERNSEVLLRYFKNIKVPVVTSFKSGHGPVRLPLPLGVEAEISTINLSNVTFEMRARLFKTK